MHMRNNLHLPRTMSPLPVDAVMQCSQLEDLQILSGMVSWAKEKLQWVQIQLSSFTHHSTAPRWEASAACSQSPMIPVVQVHVLAGLIPSSGGGRRTARAAQGWEAISHSDWWMSQPCVPSSRSVATLHLLNCVLMSMHLLSRHSNNMSMVDLPPEIQQHLPNGKIFLCV